MDKQGERPIVRDSTITAGRVQKKTPSPSKPTGANPPEMTKQGRMFRSYQLVSPFPAAGGEADIWLVRKDNKDLILKHYRLGIEPKIPVLKRVTEICQKNPHNLIRIIEYGYDERTGRWFEIQEYARKGSLKDLIQGQGISRFPFKTIIDQVTSGLHALHTGNILHLDLKPSNILIRSIRPLNLILTDFGISTLLDSELSRQITSTKGTPMYWAPEQLGNVVGKEADFWSLGVIALEILQKKHPFEGLNQNLILTTLSSRGIVVPPTIRQDYAILVKGLLTRNPKRRWGAAEIRRWLDGARDIPVWYEEEISADQRAKKPYEFRNKKFYNLQELIYAFINDPVSWEDAKRHLGRGYLTRWLESTEQYQQAVEIAKSLDEQTDEDERLLYCAARLNDEIPFTLYGKVIDVPNIILFLGKYLRRENVPVEEKIISSLFSGEIERIYLKYSEIVAREDDPSMLPRLFSWLKSNIRGSVEKKLLFHYAKALKEREDIGLPSQWDAEAVLKIPDIRKRFIGVNSVTDAEACLQDLEVAYNHIIEKGGVDAELLVAFASVFEELKMQEYAQRCLKRARKQDIKVVSLHFSRDTGFARFRRFSDILRTYERDINRLSSDPWHENAQFWKEQSLIRLEQKELGLALSAAERFIELEEKNPEGWAMRGLALFRIGRVREAEFFFSQPMIASSQSPLVWLLKGEFQEEKSDYTEAQNSFYRAISLDGRFIKAYLGLMRTHIAEKKYKSAIEISERIIQIDPEEPMALLYKADALHLSGNVTEAMRMYETLCSKKDGHTLSCIRLIRYQIKLKQFTEAERIIDNLIRKKATDPQIPRLKAFLLIQRRKREEALPYLIESLQEEPQDLWTLKAAADIQISIREEFPALISMEKILRIEPDNLTYLEKRGGIFLSMGFFAEAASDLRRVIESGTMTAELYSRCGDAVRMRNLHIYGAEHFLRDIPAQGRAEWSVNLQYLDIKLVELNQVMIQTLEEAMDLYSKALAGRDNYPDAWNGKGIVACVLKNYKDALTFFDRAQKLNPGVPAYQVNKATCTLLMGNTDQATHQFHNAISIYPRDPYLLDRYATLYSIFTQDKQKAVSLVNQAVRMNTQNDPIIPYHANQILRSAGRTSEAEATLEQIRRIDPWFVFPDR
ncbi:MAG TPA: tetratricopeptide repeat protein [Methanospirillum sp.]|nr:tetratricopeptide repeat protein [Methanospirillum sp.]